MYNHPNSRQKCTRCGKGAHKVKKCPAKEANCHCCGRKGHYSSYCFSKSRLAEIVDTEEEVIEDKVDLDSLFLDALGSNTRTQWKVPIQMNGETVSFKVDTGAEVTAISTHTWIAKALTTNQVATGSHSTNAEGVRTIPGEFVT
jgi:hypothetical protein